MQSLDSSSWDLNTEYHETGDFKIMSVGNAGLDVIVQEELCGLVVDRALALESGDLDSIPFFSTNLLCDFLGQSLYLFSLLPVVCLVSLDCSSLKKGLTLNMQLYSA